MKLFPHLHPERSLEGKGTAQSARGELPLAPRPPGQPHASGRAATPAAPRERCPAQAARPCPGKDGLIPVLEWHLEKGKKIKIKDLFY